MEKELINIVWFKRDLRLSDHEPLCLACQDVAKVLLVYFWEPSLMEDVHMDARHIQFIRESLMEMQVGLAPYNLQVEILRGEVEEVLTELSNHLEIGTIFSYQESGTGITYRRDLSVKEWTRKHSVKWVEAKMDGVDRGRKNRSGWRDVMLADLCKPVFTPDFRSIQPIILPEPLQKRRETLSTGERIEGFQQGGEKIANRYMLGFLKKRFPDYLANISKPEASRRSCARISPYLTWGNVSARQVFQQSMYRLGELTSQGEKRALEGFIARLLWRGHFIQKFEMEERIEYENMNSAYDQIRVEWNEEAYKSWEEGHTGYPLVDAAIRCVKETGYLNFRLRAMLVSFLTHHLWLDWKRGAHFLARMFLDFEPGIHYPQFHMQAATTGIHTLRIYNPVKQSLEHDPEAIFIKKWVPELAALPDHLALKPWTATYLEEKLYHFRKGVDYPLPVVDINQTYQHAQKVLWEMKDKPEVKSEASRLMAKHVNSDRQNWAKVSVGKQGKR
ncbi:MAG: FAD-binding domain-containing protein [Bacteroidota bacterium]